jgi:cytoskeleton protein RodZ
MTAIGETLRRERVKRNLELQQVSDELKISKRFLDAIEREAFGELPGAIFVRSFVRQYARLLGLDEDDMAAEAQRILEPVVEEEPRVRNPSMLPVEKVRVPPMRAWGSVGDGGRFRWSSILPALGLVVAATLVCSFVYAWWQRERRSGAVSAAQTAVSKRPAPPPAALPVPAAPAALDMGQTPAAQSEASTEARPAPANAGQGPSAGPPAPTPLVTAAPAANPPQAGTATAQAAKQPVRVEVTALATTWVRARTDGKYAFSGTLNPNQSRTVEARESVELLLGDAAGVSVVLNGKSIGAVGPKGQVRTVQLSSGGFKIVSAKAPAPEAAPAPSDPL